MTNYELGKNINNINIGKYNSKTKLFESTKDTWWRGQLSLNDIKYKILYDNNYKTLYKKAEQEYLYEGLITTVEPIKAVKILYRNAGGFIHDIRIIRNPLQIDMKTPIIDFFIYKQDYYDIEYGNIAFNELKTIINNLGYFISGQKELQDIITFVIMPKFIYDVTSSVYDSNNNDGILYHITPLKNKDKILKKGLIPKHIDYRLDNYPDRIYFYTKRQENKLQLLCKDLSQNTGITDWLILKIDLKDRRSYIENDLSTQYKFFEDPKAQFAVFTYENIDPQCIEIYKEIRLE